MIHPWLSKEREVTQVQKPHTDIGQDGWNCGILNWSGWGHLLPLGNMYQTWRFWVKIFTFLSYNVINFGFFLI